MNHSRLLQLINAYGKNSDRWPEEERLAALQQLAQDSEARQAIVNLESFDAALDSYVAAPAPHLRNMILGNLRKSWIDSCIEWLMPSFDELLAYFWRPVLAASLPLITGLLLGSSLFTVDIADTWEDEIELIALYDSSSFNE
jgi:hypothetical protein